MPAYNCKSIVNKTMWKNDKPLVKKSNAGKVTKRIKFCKRNLRLVRSFLKSQRTSVGEKRKFISTIGQINNSLEKMKCLRKSSGSVRERETIKVKWQDSECAFNERIHSGVITNLKHIDIFAFMSDALVLFQSRIKNALKKQRHLKVNVILSALYIIKKADKETVELKYFNTGTIRIQQTTELKQYFTDNVQQPIQKDMEEFQEKDSGWTLHEIVNLSVNINKYTPMMGSSYIKLPSQIEKKHACVNVKNFDKKCFMWSILSALHPVQDHSNRVSAYKKYENELDFEGLEFPVKPNDIPKFEEKNNISVNVYILKKYDGTFKVEMLHITSCKKDSHINLLLVQNDYEEEEKDDAKELDEKTVVTFHYVWIKDLSRLVSSQLSKHDGKKYFCDRCVRYFRNDSFFKKHEQYCAQNKCREILPDVKNKILKFKNFNNKEKTPFVVYADIESLIKPASKGSTYMQHEAFSVGYYLKCSYDDSLSYYRDYRGANPAKWFTEELLDLAENIETVFWCPLPIDTLTSEQEKAFQNSSTCHICEKPLNDLKVKDHCHFTGRYRGAAHKNCNLNYQNSRSIPVIFHNLTGYDSHFLIRNIAQDIPGRVKLLPLNKERFISFTKYIRDSKINFRFIDSYRFMAASLDKLASYLNDLCILKKEFTSLSDDKFKLLRRKGVFPYDFLDCVEKLSHTEIPSKDKFYSNLNDCEISDDDYKHVQQIWKEFNISNLGEYSDLYLKTDVLLLTEVFENFRTSCLSTYGLDPAHYYTGPGLTWDAMLMYTKIQLELLTDIDKVMFIERGIRGGVSQCSNRYARANNKYMSDYVSDKNSKYLMYYDANNLYGWAMQQSLPYGGFKWLSENEIKQIDFNVADDSPVGYILEVDLEYPKDLHDEHRDLPLCPQHIKPPGSKYLKLMTTLNSKERYVLHYRNLRQALTHGLRVTRVHRVLKFNQKPWLKTYIDLNTNMRSKSENEFEKNLYKLMNNAVFGKTMENVRKRVDVRLVTKWKGRYGAEALIAKPNFNSSSILNKNLVVIELNKTEVYLNKPIYVGLCVLDISKSLVYDFHYNFMKKKIGENCKLLYTDTDSLIYEVGVDIYEIMKQDIQKFDTSDYPVDNIFEMPQVNKKVVGLMKDECNGRIMTEFVGLRSKMYSIRVDGEDKIKKIKGIKTAVVQNTIRFDDYLECLKNMSTQFREQSIICSQKHNVFTRKQVKLALSPYDDKRYLIPDETETLPWGHYKINNV